MGRTFLSVSSVFGRSLPAAIRAYRRRYPEVDLRLRELGTMLQIDVLREGSVDLGFLRDPGRSTADDRGTLARAVRRSPAVASFARFRTVAVKKLKGEPFIFHRRGIGPLAFDRTMAVCRQAGFLPEIVQEAP